jgi:hypothetical protein
MMQIKSNRVSVFMIPWTLLLVLGIAGISSAQTEFLSSDNRIPTLQSDSGPFNKIWYHTFSRSNMADEVGEGGAVLANGTLLTVGLSGNLPNHCRGYFGGGLAFDLTASGGNIKWERLASRDCTNDEQWFTAAAATADGGAVLSGEDFNPARCTPCAWFFKIDRSGNPVLSQELVGYGDSGLTFQPTPTGYFGVGFEDPHPGAPVHGIVAELSPSGGVQGSQDFTEDHNSFRGAMDGGDVDFESSAPLTGGDMAVSGTAGSNTGLGYALLVGRMNVSSARPKFRWLRAYIGANWSAWAPGASKYQLWEAPDGNIVVSGLVRGTSFPFEVRFLWMELAASSGSIVRGPFGFGESDGFHGSFGVAGASTPDGGSILAGQTDGGGSSDYDGELIKLASDGTRQWAKGYRSYTPFGAGFNAVLPIQDGFAAIGENYFGSASYGGPGYWVLTTDAQGNVGTWDGVHDLAANAELIDLQPYPATLIATNPTLSFVPVTMSQVNTHATLVKVYP